MSEGCDSFREGIADSLDKGHEEPLDKQLQQHISECPDCAAFQMALKNEDQLLGSFFSGLQAGLERQQDDVISAVFCIETSRKDKFIAKINSFIDHPAFKLAAAAAVIVFVAFYSAKTLSWLYDLKHFMDVCSVTIK
jgi:hypothetical protein